MHILLPKTVEIKNGRLSAIYFLCVASAATFLIVRFFKERIYFGQLPMDKQIEVALWVDGVTTDLYAELSAQFDRQFQSPLCTNPGQYDYWFSESWKYTNHTCMPLCPVGQASRDCASLRDIYVTESPSQAVLLTQVQDSWMGPGTNSTSSSLRFMPSVEALTVGFQYSYNLDSTTMDIQDPYFDGDQLKGASSVNVLTVLLDSDHKPNRTFYPNSSISVSLPELLQLAGRPNLLDEPQDELGRNLLETAAGKPYESGPAARLSGADVVLHIDCKNFHEYEQHEFWTGVVCYVSVTTNQAWTNVERVDLVGSDGELRHRQYHGLRVKVETSGYLHYYDINAIYMYFVSFIVVMQLPKLVVVFVAKYCLGHLSTIYGRMLNDASSLSDQVAGLASRLMANGVVFAGLEDRAGGISKKGLAERLKESLKHRGDTMSDAEVKNFVDYCFYTILKETNTEVKAPKGTDRAGIAERSQTMRSWNSVGSRIAQKFRSNGRTSSTIAGDDRNHISIDDFNKACSSLDPMSFESVIKLFDKDRKRHFLERFFTPWQIKKHVYREEDPAVGSIEALPAGASAPSRPPRIQPSMSKELLELLGLPQSKSVESEHDFLAIMLEVAQEEARNPQKGQDKRPQLERSRSGASAGPDTRPSVAFSAAFSQQKEDLARANQAIAETAAREKVMQARLDRAFEMLQEMSRTQASQAVAEVEQCVHFDGEAEAVEEEIAMSPSRGHS